MAFKDLPLHMLKGLDPNNTEICTIRASVVTGLEVSARDEISSKLRSVAYISRGRVLFDVKVDCIQEVFKLRSIDHAFVLVSLNPHFKFSIKKEECFQQFRLLPHDLFWNKALKIWKNVNKSSKNPLTQRSGTASIKASGDDKNGKVNEKQLVENDIHFGEGDHEEENRGKNSKLSEVQESSEIDASGNSLEVSANEAFPISYVLKSLRTNEESKIIESKSDLKEKDAGTSPGKDAGKSVGKDAEEVDLFVDARDTSFCLEKADENGTVSATACGGVSSNAQQVSPTESPKGGNQSVKTKKNTIFKGYGRSSQSKEMGRSSQSKEMGRSSQSKEMGRSSQTKDTKESSKDIIARIRSDIDQLERNLIGEKENKNVEIKKQKTNQELDEKNVVKKVDGDVKEKTTTELGSPDRRAFDLFTMASRSVHSSRLALNRNKDSSKNTDLYRALKDLLGSYHSVMQWLIHQSSLRINRVLMNEMMKLSRSMTHQLVTDQAVTNQSSPNSSSSSDNKSKISSDERNEINEDTLPSFGVNGVRSGNMTGMRSGHPFSSNDAADWFGGAVQDMFGWNVKMKDFDIEVLLEMNSDALAVSVGLTTKALCMRNIVDFGPTTLRASICYNMLMLARPQPGELCCDPLSGSGAIPIEGALGFPGTFHFAGDLFCAKRFLANAQYALRNDKENVKKRDSKNSERSSIAADVTRWDARFLPLRDASIDVFCTDFPFGKRMGNKYNNRTLYPAVLIEMARVCVPRHGRAIILTQDINNMYKVLHLRSISPLWSSRYKHHINIGGLSGIVYLLMRTDFIPKNFDEWKEKFGIDKPNKGETKNNGGRKQRNRFTNEKSSPDAKSSDDSQPSVEIDGCLLETIEAIKTSLVLTEPILKLGQEPLSGSEPTKMECGSSEPIKSEPAASEPVKSLFISNEPVDVDSFSFESLKTSLDSKEPMKMDSNSCEPVGTEPVISQPMKTESALCEPTVELISNDPAEKQPFSDLTVMTSEKVQNDVDDNAVQHSPEKHLMDDIEALRQPLAATVPAVAVESEGNEVDAEGK